MAEEPLQLNLAAVDEQSPPTPHSRPRNPIWDTMEMLFGSVAELTNAHAKRNKAVRDLQRLGATAETITYAHRAYLERFNGVACTDIALATHYPSLAPRARTPACPECGVGGGMHSVECPSLEKRAAL